MLGNVGSNRIEHHEPVHEILVLIYINGEQRRLW